MRQIFGFTLAMLALTRFACGQDDVPTFKAEASSAFVWADVCRDAVCSSVRDPVTGNTIRKLNHGGIEVASQAGFETVDSEGRPELLNFTITIVNNTESELSVRQPRASMDGHVVLPLPVVHTKKGLGKTERNQVWELASMNCFSSGFLPNEIFLSPSTSSTVFTVAPKRPLTVSFVTKAPHLHSLRCSVGGCYPKGSIRFSVTVNATDYVFTWPGRDMVSCGK